MEIKSNLFLKSLFWLLLYHTSNCCLKICSFFFLEKKNNERKMNWKMDWNKRFREVVYFWNWILSYWKVFESRKEMDILRIKNVVFQNKSWYKQDDNMKHIARKANFRKVKIIKIMMINFQLQITFCGIIRRFFFIIFSWNDDFSDLIQWKIFSKS